MSGFAPNLSAPPALAAFGAMSAFVANAPAPAVLPSALRTLRPVVTGYAGRKFLAVAPTDSVPCTFDLSLVLGGATIASVVSYVLETADAASAMADPNPGSRLVAGPAIDSTATQVTVRIGNLLPGLAAINYRLGPIVRDSQGNVLDSFSILPVWDRSDPLWLMGN
jgi:hypothetical protein